MVSLNGTTEADSPTFNCGKKVAEELAELVTAKQRSWIFGGFRSEENTL